jgi:hypothetical protein
LEWEVIDMGANLTVLGLPLIALVIGVSGCTSAPNRTRAPSEAAPSESPAATESAAGTVQVTVSDLEGSKGGGLAGVLVSGPEAKFFDELVVGGFGVAVDAEPFTTTQTVNEPGEEFKGLFPFVTDTPIQVAPGTYTLMLWAAPQDLGAYGRWVPADTNGLRGCRVTFEAAPGSGATLTVNGLPDWGGYQEAPEAACSTTSG